MNNIYEIKKLYALIIYCDNYLENHYRLRVFNTLNQAKNFCKKTFKTPNGQYEFFEVNKGRFAFYPKEDDYEIESIDRVGQKVMNVFDVREVEIRQETFIINNEGKIAKFDNFSDRESIKNLKEVI